MFFEEGRERKKEKKEGRQLGTERGSRVEGKGGTARSCEKKRGETKRTVIFFPFEFFPRLLRTLMERR